MKKRTIVLLALLSVTMVIEACNMLSHGKEGKTTPPSATTQTAVNTESLPSTPKQAVETAESYIGETKALEIALNHAKVDTTALLFSKSILDRDDGRVVYDVEFYAGNKEYDYEIDAVSGNILGFDADMEFDFVPSGQQAQLPSEQPTPAPETQQQPAPSPETQQQPAPVQEQPKQQVKQENPAPAASSSVNMDSAKQIALAKVPGATQDHIRIKEDYDDGRLVYEGKIIYQQMEYDFEIDAASGRITDWDSESIYD